MIGTRSMNVQAIQFFKPVFSNRGKKGTFLIDAPESYKTQKAMVLAREILGTCQTPSSWVGFHERSV